MVPTFCIAGPVRRSENYCIPPLGRAGIERLGSLVAESKYFVLHAPRQTGKTTALLELACDLRAQGLRALYVNVEPAQTSRNDVLRGMQATISGITLEAKIAGIPVPEAVVAAAWSAGIDAALRTLLSEWSLADPAHPVVLFIDEIDALNGDVLVSHLRQLRALYPNRGRAAPQSVVLCGVRDVKDYRIHTSTGEVITGGSAFNIKEVSLRLGDFSRDELNTLYGQHTAATGQAFAPDALDLCWELTRGQPWLVNALGRELCFEMDEGRDRTQPVTESMVQIARQRLIVARATHIDQLAYRLREDRVRRVVAPIVSGEGYEVEAPEDDLNYAIDLGLVARRGGKIEIANAIYSEVLPRVLTTFVELNLGTRFDVAWCRATDGSLDLERLLSGFQDFFRANGEHAWPISDYREAEVQLVMQAYLQRVINGGGVIEREYGLGRGRTDLFVRWPCGPADRQEQRFVIEIKVQRGTREAVVAEGLPQVTEYADRCRASAAHLVIFDRRPGISWEERIFRESRTHGGREVGVWGM